MQDFPFFHCCRLIDRTNLKIAFIPFLFSRSKRLTMGPLQIMRIRVRLRRARHR